MMAAQGGDILSLVTRDDGGNTSAPSTIEVGIALPPDFFVIAESRASTSGAAAELVSSTSWSKTMNVAFVEPSFLPSFSAESSIV